MKNTLRYIFILLAMELLGLGNVWGSGTYTVGTGGDYTRLQLAFKAINDGAISGDIVFQIISNITESIAPVLNASGSGSCNYTSVTIYPTGTARTITRNSTAPVIDLVGADNVTIDGRIDQTGSTKSLTFTNTNNANPTIRFKTSAENNSIKYCIIKGANASTTSGIILFTTSTAGNGNDNNTIEYNDITNAGTRPANPIYSLGASGYDNSGNTIQNNNIYDFLNAGIASNGILLEGYTSAWSILNNSFYETSSITPTANVDFTMIRVNNSGGNSFTISGNYIGGSSASCSGTLTKTNDFNNAFYGIYINASSTTSSIQGNRIKNFNWSNAGAANWSGIYVAGSTIVNIGTSTGNTIGGASGVDSILVTAGANNANGYGIYLESSNTVDCQNNTIGAFTMANVNADYASSFYGVFKTSTTGTTTISNNIIGSTSTSNSINANSSCTANNQNVIGIYTLASGSLTINNNTIVNLTNSCTNSNGTSTSQVAGIVSLNGNTTVSNNTIRDFSISTGNTSKNIEVPTVGIAINSSGTNAIYGNTIYGLYNNLSSTTFGGNVFGIYLGSAGTTQVYKNFIHTLSIYNPNNSSSIVGINLSGLSGSIQTLYNNIVSLDAAKNTNLYGLLDNTGLGTSLNNQTTKIYFNTIYIGGTISSTEKSYAIQSTYDNNAASCVRDYRNNIFFNARASNGTDYSIYYNSGSLTSLIADFNNYFVTGTSGKIAYVGTDITTLAALKIATDQDTFSEKNNPLFTSGGSTTATDYKISEEFVGVAETGMSISDDFGGSSREYYSMMGAWEGPINKWKGNISNDWNTSGNWTRNFVPAVDASIYFHNTPENHCVQDQNRSVMNIFNNTAYHTVLNGKKLTLKGNLNFEASAKADASSTSSNLEFAGIEQQKIPFGALYNDEVYNLTINNSSNVKLYGTLRLLNTITATSGLLDATTTTPTVSYAGAVAQYIESGKFVDEKVENLIIDNATGVTVNCDFLVDNNLTINNGKHINIAPEKLLTINTTSGTITNNAGTSGLVIKASSTAANGSLIFQQGLTVPATVEMYSKASWDANLENTDNNKYKWQYFGIPVSSISKAPTFNDAYVRSWKEYGTTIYNHWALLTNDSSLTPFTGYEICQLNPKTYSFAGNLVSEDYSYISLPYTAGALYSGQQILANPYTAAIDIANFLNPENYNLGSEVEQSVYLYNTGSFAEWETNNGETTYDGTTTTAGQYTVSTAETAGSGGGVPSQIPSMQAFLVKSMVEGGDNWINIPYASIVSKNTELQRNQSNSKSLSKIWTRIDVRSTHFADKMWVFTDSICTRRYDKGWDGSKLFGSARTPQIFAIEADGNYQINALADMNNSDLGFQPGEDKEFTIRFTHENTDSRYSNICLLDFVAKTTTDITVSGTEYKFTAIPNTKATKRFKIITTKKEVTSEPVTQIKIYSVDGMIYLQSNSTEKGELKLYDISGRLIQQSTINANNSTAVFQYLAPGVYLAKTIFNGKEITKRLLVR